jgi:hypothetical protein
MGFHPDVGRQIEFRSRAGLIAQPRLLLKKSSRSANHTRGVESVRSTFAKAPMLPGVVSKITGARSTSVPRRHSLTVLA